VGLPHSATRARSWYGSGSTLIGRGLKVRSEEVVDTATARFRETESLNRSGARFPNLVGATKIAGRDFRQTHSPRSCGTDQSDRVESAGHIDCLSSGVALREGMRGCAPFLREFVASGAI